MRKYFLLFVFLFASRCMAAGGACPSVATYTSLTNPTGAQVTLSSLGITSCYFVAANGVDTNTGTDESHPWLHAPWMPNCANSCATIQNALVPAGTGIIFRGGDTWHMGNSGAAPYTGGGWNINTHTTNGTAANPIYIGVDSTWFSGGSWARPILTGDNPLCSQALVNGTTCLSGTIPNGTPQYYVSSCSFQIAGNGNQMVDFTSRKYYIFDNFEMLGICEQTTGQPGHHDVYFSYGSPAGPLYFLNNYVHGSSHLQFAANNGANCAGLVCFGISTFQGGGAGTPETIALNVIDYTDSDPAANGLCQSGFANVFYNVFDGTSQCITAGMHLVHDNLYINFFENGHSNVLESNNNADASGTNAVYNNVFFNIESACTSACGVFLWPSPPTGTTDYVFNNIFYNVGNMEIFNVGLNGSDQGPLVVFNNTWQLGFSGALFGNSINTHVHLLTSANNHLIGPGTLYACNTCQVTDITNLVQTATQANSNSTPHFDQYTSSETFAFSPTASTNSTVATGTNEQSQCSALTTAAGSDSTLNDAAAACGNDTRYACFYITSNHTVSCPARATGQRPGSAAFDRGAYQFVPSTPNTAPAPTILAGASNQEGTVTLP